MQAMLRVSDEFGFKVSAFHHALEAWMAPELFKPRNITIATFADLWGFKVRAWCCVVWRCGAESVFRLTLQWEAYHASSCGSCPRMRAARGRASFRRTAGDGISE